MSVTMQQEGVAQIPQPLMVLTGRKQYDAVCELWVFILSMLLINLIKTTHLS